ncbi:MAG: Ig-like domain-containing protein, partial [Burkholderiales bacterium]
MANIKTNAGNACDDDRNDGRDHTQTIVGTNGNNILIGTSRGDVINALKGDDTVYGGAGSDRLNGGQGDDTLIGGAGNDYIDGGPHGYDTAVYSGNYRDYRISFSAGPADSEGYKITVIDTRDGSPDGTDMLRRIEVMKFADGEYRDGHFYPSGPDAQVTAIIALSADTGASNSDFITNQALQMVTGTFSGTLRASDHIQVSADGGASWVNASVSGHSWSASGVTLVAGSGSLLTQTVDTAGHALAGTGHDYVLDTTVAAPSLAATFVDSGVSPTDGITSATKAMLSGVAEADATVQVYDGSTLIATVSADDNGSWSYKATGLANGTHDFSATQTDVAGNASAASAAATMIVDTVVAAPSLVASFVDSGLSATDNITNATAATLSGAAEAGATVKVYDGGTLLGTVGADAITGAWSYSATGLSDGAHGFKATQTDLAGNASGYSAASAMIVDTAAPAAPTLSVSFTDTGVLGDGITSATSAVLSGIAEKNAQVQIYDGSALVTTVSANASTGAWIYALTGLPDGPHDFSATATDAAGNAGGASAASAMMVITTASAPGVGLTTDTGVSHSDHISSNDALKGTAQPGATVTIYEGTNALGMATADSGGNWTFTPAGLADGAHALTVTAVDVAGNTASSAFSFTLDTSTAAPVIALADDTGTLASDGITNSDALKGTAEAGATVTVHEGANALGTTTADGSGNWTFTPATLADGAHALTVTATDVAGNAASGAFGFTLDTSTATPTLALISDTGTSARDGITYGDALKGTAEAGATVTVYEGTNTLGTVAADGGGNWTFTPAALADGAHSLTVTATDVAGNVSAQSSPFSFTLDTHAPFAPTLLLAHDTGTFASDGVTSNDALNGTAEAGATVTVYEGANALGTATADGSGNWTLTSITLADGAHTLTATAADAAGNSSAATTLAFTLDTTIHAPAIAAVDGTVASGGTTTDATPTLSGTADAGTTVTVSDGSTVLGSTTADGAGAWTYTTALSDGASHSLTVQSVDLAGNASSSGVFSLTVDSGSASLFAPVLSASLTAASYTDQATPDTFGPATGSLSATETGTPPGTPQFTYGVIGGAASTALSGYDTAEAGHYGTLYLNSSSGDYAFAPDSAAINALPQTAAFIGDDFALAVSDGLGGTDSKALTISLTGANDTPVLSASLSSTSYTDTPANDVFSPVTGELTTVDPDTGATHVYGATGANASSAITGFDLAAAGAYGTLYLNGASGAYEFVPDSAAINALPAGASASDSFTLTVSDGSAGSSLPLTINVSGANDTPQLTASVSTIAYTDSAAADAFTATTGVLTASDADAGATHVYGVSGGAASSAITDFNLAMAGAYGTLYLSSASGAYEFVPDSAAINALPAGASASDSFTLSVSDGS